MRVKSDRQSCCPWKYCLREGGQSFRSPSFLLFTPLDFFPICTRESFSLELLSKVKVTHLAQAPYPILTPLMINHFLFLFLSLSLISLFFPFLSSFPLSCQILPSFAPSAHPYPSSPPPVTASSLGEQKVHVQQWSLSHCLAFSMIRLSLRSAEWG